MTRPFLLLLALAGCQLAPAGAGPAASASPAEAPTAPAVTASADQVAMATPTAAPAASCQPTSSKSTVSFGARSIRVDLAYTDASRTLGLSGRPCLAAETGLVLGWDAPRPVRIWMPDMNFAIDVVFVRDAKVVSITQNAQPCPSRADCPTFGPATPVDYVLEVPAGSTRAWGLKAGDAITLKK